MVSRRDVLKGGAFLGGAAALAGVLPASVQRAYAITPEAGSTYLDAEHIVVLMQENRSFDHMFGTMQGVRGFNDPRPLRHANGAPIFFQRNKKGRTFAPWRLNTQTSCIAWLGAIPHGRTDQVDAWNGGLHNNWIEAKRSGTEQAKNIPLTMGYCTREDLPFYYALADAFTVCDQNYCSLLTMTAPNRLMMWNGTVREPTQSGSLVHMYNHMTHMGGLTWTSFGERLYDAGVKWKCYQNHIYCETPYFGQPADAWLGNDGDNSMERLAGYGTAFSEPYQHYINGVIDRAQTSIAARKAELEAEYARSPTPDTAATLNAYAEQAERLEKKREASRKTLADCTPRQLALRARGLATNANNPDYLSLAAFEYEADGAVHMADAPKSDVLYQFRLDVQSGALPTVSWLVAPTNFSFHPSAPWYGEWYISEIINILTENPEVWKKTIFILTFDENDGFFDHCPSFVAADPSRPETGRASEGIDLAAEYTTLEDDMLQGIAHDDARAAPFGLGYRVPMIVASPWSRGGWVNSQLTDHTSIIQFIQNFVEKKFKRPVVETNISDWRRTICGDLVSCFRRFDGEKDRLPFVDQAQHLPKIAATKYKPLPAGWADIAPADAARLRDSRDEQARYLWQEPGSRPACALPYELSCEGEVGHDGRHFQLRMKAGDGRFGKMASGAPFNVYLYGTKSGSQLHALDDDGALMEAMTFTVRAGDELVENIDLARFSGENFAISVHAPNGFFRHFSGRKGAASLKVEARLPASDIGIVECIVSNPSDKPVELTIRQHYADSEQTHALPAFAVASFAFDVKPSDHWYDFDVQVTGANAAVQRFAGHVETGQPSTTDPAMAG